MDYITTEQQNIIPSQNKDCSDDLQSFFDNIADDTTAVISPGEYYLEKAVKIHNHKNVKILGYGVTLIARYNLCNPYAFAGVFDVFDCENCEICGMKVTTDKRPNSLGRVVNIDYDKLIVDICLIPEHTLTGKEKIYCFDSCDEDFVPNRHCYFAYGDGYGYLKLSRNVIRLIAHPSLRSQILDIRKNELICMKHSLYPKIPILFWNCSDIVVKDVTVESAPGVACGIYPRCKNFTFKRFCIRLPHGNKRVYSSNADGIHVTGLEGKLVVEDCIFENLGDDAINVHNEGATVHNVGNGVISCYSRRFNSTPHEKSSRLNKNWAKKGDTVDVYDSKTFGKKGSFTVAAYDVNRIEFEDKDIDFQIEAGDYLANATFFCETEIRRCIMKNSRARAFVLQTHNVTVEDCRFIGMAISAIIVSPDMVTWSEMGPMENLTIRNNVFERCGNAANTVCGGIIIGNCHHDLGGIGDVYPAGMHRNIIIENNKFINVDSPAVIALSVDGLKINNNVIIEPNEKYTVNRESAPEYMMLKNCDGIEFENNQLIGDTDKEMCNLQSAVCVENK